MPDPVNLPDLIISLSHDNVSLQLSGNADAGREAWAAKYPIEALFVEDQLSHAFDHALNENPSLIDHFDQVEVVVIDEPNLCIPQQYANDGQWAEIAARYLRNRNGDKLISNHVSSDAILAYNFPASAISLIQEYYANAGQLHLTAILWNSIYNHVKDLPAVGLRLFYILKGETLIILGESSGKLAFTKTCFVPDSADLNYYSIAYGRLMQPAEKWIVTIDAEPTNFKLDKLSDVHFHHSLELAAMRSLIARHRSCES